jgi:IS1 family transposase
VEEDLIMAPTPLFYQLLVVALVLICLLIHIGLPDKPLSLPQLPLASTKRRRTRSTAPKPFPGLLRQPLCEACAQEADARPTAPGSPPPFIRFTRGRRRTVNPQSHFCPAPECAYHGWLARGNIRANGYPGRQPWRQLQCVACQGYCSATHGTIFHGKHASPDLIVRVIACLAEGLGSRGTAHVFEIDPHTVLSWWVDAAEQLKAFSAYFLHELPLKQVQLDELYAVLSAVRDGDMSEAEAIERLSRAPHWVWTAIDPESKLLLNGQVGDRTLALAQAVLHQIVPLLAPGCVPLLLSDGYPHYLTAIVTHFGCWVHPPRKQATGPAPKPRWMPLPQLCYAQVIKTVRRRRLVRVSHRVVFGSFEAVQRVLAAGGWQINTAFVERLNLSLRQRVAAIGRRSATLCKSEEGLRQQLGLCPVYHHFVLPHTSLRQALAEPVPTNGRGAAKVWRPCTPAMAAGLTAHVWSLREVWLFRVPPWPQPQTIYNMAWGDERGVTRLRCAHMQAQRVERSVENPFAVLRTG